ncbi:MAG: hypothetical protein LBK25_03890 [Treponema sp.]|nr:hypothetical protein [Treponema sp.]
MKPSNRLACRTMSVTKMSDTRSVLHLPHSNTEQAPLACKRTLRVF